MASRLTFSTWSTFCVKAAQLSGVPAPTPFKPIVSSPVSRPGARSFVLVQRDVALRDLVRLAEQPRCLAHGETQRLHVLPGGVELVVHALLELPDGAVRVLCRGHTAERAFLFVVHSGDLVLGLFELVLELLHLTGSDAHRVRVVDRHGSSSPSQNLASARSDVLVTRTVSDHTVRLRLRRVCESGATPPQAGSGLGEQLADALGEQRVVGRGDRGPVATVTPRTELEEVAAGIGVEEGHHPARAVRDTVAAGAFGAELATRLLPEEHPGKLLRLP